MTTDTINVRAIFGQQADSLAVMDSDNPLRAQLVKFAADNKGFSPEELDKALVAYQAKAGERAEAAKKKVEREARRNALEALGGKVRAAKNVDEARELLAEVSAAKGQIFLTETGFDTTIKIPNRGGGSGKGRPKATDPTGFGWVNGDPILGSFTAAIKTRHESEPFGEDMLGKLAKLDENGGVDSWRTKAVMAKRLVKAGIIEVVETSEASNSSDDSVSPDSDDDDS